MIQNNTIMSGSDNSKVKKILLLTLGTGMLSENGDAGYRSTQYTIEGKTYRKNGVATKTNFVAEPIIDKYVPDEIFILGTIKSVWHQLYASTITSNNEDTSYLDNEDYKWLFNVEKDNGIDTDSNQLEQYEKKISDIFNNVKSWEKYSSEYKERKPGIHVIITKYGISEDELKENYGKLKCIEKYLSTGNTYEVAFDITHSFRSLPIYNLIIFNYIKNITKYNIKISHVYYGNIEVARELNGAPIVDLVDLVQVLDLTNGVAEFKDTGNAVSLLNMLEKSDPVKDTLECFDLSTQLNAFDKIKDELHTLCRLIKEQAFDQRYTGVREMIGTILSERFLGKDISELDSVNDIDLKFMLTKWFFNQNRMGLGLATGLEALRDLNTPAFMEQRGFLGEDERRFRENAENYFIIIAEKLNKSCSGLSALEDAVCKLGVRLRHYKEIRNIFAHSLSSDQNVNLQQIRLDIETFKNNLFELKALYECNPKQYSTIFCPAENTGGTKVTSSACRIVIDFCGSCKYDDYKQAKSGRLYDVYGLDDKVRRKILGNWASKDYKTSEKAFVLYLYLKKNMLEGYKDTEIILFECNEFDREVIFKVFLEEAFRECGSVKYARIRKSKQEDLRKINMKVDLDFHKNNFDNSKVCYDEIFEIGLIKH